MVVYKIPQSRGEYTVAEFLDVNSVYDSIDNENTKRFTVGGYYNGDIIYVP